MTQDFKEYKSALDNRIGGILKNLAFKQPKPAVAEEWMEFDIEYYFNDVYGGDGTYQAVYQHWWNEEAEDVVGMDFVYGSTVKELINNLATVLGRKIKNDEWSLGYDERNEEN